MRSPKIPILTYHSAQVDGMDYGANDHQALATDLELIAEEGFRVVPLSWVVEWLRGERSSADLQDAVAITFDDGCSMDFWDMDHPRWGRQRSFCNILRDFRDAHASSQPHVHATTFVIASPATRRALGANLPGLEWISDDWWAEAARSGLMAVENHSWDHNHPLSPVVCQREQVKGRFDNIDTFAECEAEVVPAGEYIAARAGVRPTLFAYPWGQASDYFVNEYFPRNAARHGCRAAFTAHDGIVTSSVSLWAIPRLVFRANWSTCDELKGLLLSARS
ncbi:polysaccharide deacetylase family protein [Candidatus Binatia bacterium]|nr:polysaccharide deacetylase family protein [Candidatus Binatia bacterium]